MKNLRANSFFNGISFSNSKQFARTIVNKDGTYKTQKSNTFILTLSEKIIIEFYLITSIFIILFSIFKLNNLEVIIGNSIFCFFFYLPCISFFSSIYFSIFRSESRKYHSAEHKIINFIKEYNKIPTLEEAKKESRFCTTCTSLKYTKKFLLGIIWIILLYSNLQLLHKVIFFSLLYLVIHILYRINIFVFLQFIFTSPKVSDKHIIIGISTLQELQKQ